MEKAKKDEETENNSAKEMLPSKPKQMLNTTTEISEY